MKTVVQERKEEIMNETEPRKNKYELVGGNAVHSNPFGADPANQAVVEKRTEQAEDQFSSSVQMEKEFSIYPTVETPKSVPGTPAVEMESPEKPETPKGFRLNPILVVAAAALLVLGTAWMLGIFRKKSNSVDGSYRFTHVDVRGEEVSPDQLAAYGVNTKNMSLKIDGNEADLTVFGFTGHCDFTMEGDKFTITNGSKQMSGKADIAGNTVRLQNNGADIVFVKE